jgi:hypothetical protein
MKAKEARNAKRCEEETTWEAWTVDREHAVGETMRERESMPVGRVTILAR